MKLPDFTEFEPFVELRRAMGARKRGHFELFDPERHLTGRERSELDREGRYLPWTRLKHLADDTWGYKNTRLAVYLSEAEDYHLAQCEVTQTWEAGAYVWISTRRTGPLPLGPEQETRKQVCAHCLQLLGYKGFDLHRNRKIAYSKQLLKTFSRDEFFKVYKLYPVQGVGER
ncbi:hypothetical protein SAMN05660443_0978 [Marinospirillum celere]|uniref:Uncharacterized protein n=1 Tax=Marinospirillum celere TaxID=1122252 RepID=A0A1I1FF74_9GAMM|nr:hypothetical protein [Marinospirillum celere]SFB97934.1 hypothetical protein SAMN05660443_0978 [Marinospirillum celere]